MIAKPRMSQTRCRWRESIAGGLAVLVMAAVPVPAGAAGDLAGGVLARVRQNGVVRCAVDQTPGFSEVDGTGRPAGFDVDFCRAVAAAALGSADAIITQRVSTANKFKALVDGDLDVGFGMTTWTYNRDAGLGVTFPAVIFYDGQGLMAWADGAPAQAAGARGKVCVQQGTTSASTLTDFIRAQAPGLEPVPAPTSEDKWLAFAQRRCDLVTGDRSELAARRATMAPDARRWLLLPDILSREPLGPVVARGDEAWATLVRWAVTVPVIAEAKGITAASIEPAAAAADGDIETRRLLGNDPAFGKELGLAPQWAARIIAQVGNYAEIYRRNLATIAPDRGQNALWRQGGLLFPPPLR